MYLCICTVSLPSVADFSITRASKLVRLSSVLLLREPLEPYRLVLPKDAVFARVFENPTSPQ